MTEPWVAVLPSRDEAATITAVAEAADQAIHDERGLIINVDHSQDRRTAQAFARATVGAQTHALVAPRAGKGHQVLVGLAGIPAMRPVLVIDTDTRNPIPERYRALMRAVESGADLAVAHYRRHWYEGNLTNHIARPLIAATVGLDLAQPLAGDIALSARALRALRCHYDSHLGESVKACADGYGIDALIVLSCAAAHLDIRDVSLPGVKEHAPSFPHLRQIFHDAIPVLLATTAHSTIRRRISTPLVYDVEPTALPESSRHHMLDVIRALRTNADTEALPGVWPEALIRAWLTVQAGNNPTRACGLLWPAYLDRVTDYLTLGSAGGHTAACTMLTQAAATIVDRLNTSPWHE